MAELRQLSLDGKRIKEAVEAVENSSAGLEITNGELTLANVPEVSLGTITDTDLQEWLAKGLPIEVDNSCYIASSIGSISVHYVHLSISRSSVDSSNYLIPYTYLQYSVAEHTLALESTDTANAQYLQEGTGIDITDGKVSVDNIPNVSLNTELSSEVIDWVEKGYPVFYTDVDDTNLYSFNGDTALYIYYSSFIAGGVTSNNYPMLIVKLLVYDKTNKIFVQQNVVNVSAASASLGGFIKLGSDTVQTDIANSPSSTAGKTYPVQLDSSGKAVVNVPWERGAQKYLHQVQFEVTNTAFGYIHININFVLDTDTALTAVDIAPLISIGDYMNPNKYPCSGVAVANDDTISYITGINALGTSATVQSRPTIPVSTTFNVVNANNVTDVVTPL